MIVINNAWSKSFMIVDKNIQAICDCGWYPYNGNLLRNVQLRSTMMDADIVSETESTAAVLPSTDIVTCTNSPPTFDPAYLLES